MDLVKETNISPIPTSMKKGLLSAVLEVRDQVCDAAYNYYTVNDVEVVNKQTLPLLKTIIERALATGALKPNSL